MPPTAAAVSPHPHHHTMIQTHPPQTFREEAQRPTVEKIEDELDQWGRPKKRLANPIDVMPDDMQVGRGQVRSGQGCVQRTLTRQCHARRRPQCITVCQHLQLSGQMLWFAHWPLGLHA